ncbi:MAG: PQQ-dependent dehydrogenase, methanol/ethanol family [Flavobacteriaceae bacterium]|nr:MAG: PQQ-dependent dehydrogenase, methanol/ethanol family [Flavobacteriaceae bacterium]
MSLVYLGKDILKKEEFDLITLINSLTIMKKLKVSLKFTLVFLCLAIVSCSNDKKSKMNTSSSNKTTSADVGWSTYGNDYTNKRYSELSQINAGNVDELKVVWEKSLNINEAQECTPIVVGKTIYVTTSNGPKYVYALDAVTGAQKWVYSPEIPQDFARYACCGIVNRAPAYADGKLFVGRLDGRLVALDAETGKELWNVEVVDYKQGSAITSPPTVINGKVITGFGGGEYGANGYLSAFDVNTGKLLWKYKSTDGANDKNVRDSWKGKSYETGGGVFWYIGSYDAKLNLLYYGTSNPAPWNSSLRGSSTFDYGGKTNLYTCSIIALNPDTGKMQWYYQTNPFDAWDYDGVNEQVLAELLIEGVETPVLMQANRNGFFYVIDRRNGKLISAEKFVHTNWAEKIDLETGIPVEVEKYRLTPTNTVKAVYPSFIGGKNWQPMSFNPDTGLVYIPANRIGMDFKMSEVNYQRGYFYLGTEWAMVYEEDGPTPGEYIAWDPVKQEKAWGIDLKFPIPPGSITTKGGLVFFGSLEGAFYAHDATTGKQLWSYKTSSGIAAAPMTYSIDGVQYVAVLEGRPSVIPGFVGGEMGEKMVEATPAGGKIFVFAL